MQKLVAGVHRFQQGIFGERRRFFEQLSSAQKPLALFITCSDSRVNPNLVTQTEPGELFILRNAGNIVPPLNGDSGGEAATIEYAIAALKITDIVVCGHTCCGAMQALLEPGTTSTMPHLRKWLEHAENTRRIVLENYSHLHGGSLLTAAVEENVLVQLEHLRTHAAVATAMARGALHLHGWVYKIESGEVFSFNPEQGQFAALENGQPLPNLRGGRAAPLVI